MYVLEVSKGIVMYYVCIRGKQRYSHVLFMY